MKQKNTISFDEQKFSKVSKKLLNQFNDLVPQENQLKLTQVQEMLSKSFGYRNYYELKNSFNDERASVISSVPVGTSAVTPMDTKVKFLSNMELESIMNLINLFMNKQSDSLLRDRAISFVSAVLFSLVELRDKKEIILDVTCLKDYLLLDNIFKLREIKGLSNRAKEILSSYLNSIPGFQMSAVKQNSIVYEQHGYLSMQFSGLLDKLEKIENDNFVVADSSWFLFDMNYKLKISPVLLNIDYLEDSWIYMDSYQEWIKSLKKMNKLENVTVLDLFQYIGTIMSPVKRDKMFVLLNVFLDNYHMARTLSKEITLKMSKYF